MPISVSSLLLLLLLLLPNFPSVNPFYLLMLGLSTSGAASSFRSRLQITSAPYVYDFSTATSPSSETLPPASPATYFTDKFVTHFTATHEAAQSPQEWPTFLESIQSCLTVSARFSPLVITPLSTLITLGSIYYLPPDSLSHVKPIRVTPEHLPTPLPPNAYLRVHFHPRRFPLPPTFHCLPVLVHEDAELGLTVINKPRGLPVHSTVDNQVENMLHQVCV